ncbi:thiamine diphosphate-binding protein [Neohortaea acidophila]|uniref:Pyruvate decarboxylase n=1 Tax=Neohortaea acidophila TaxID=245834 RepID=A0A6A6PYX0_9PEZI|nr:thiamine diphosphate-binding protein [Neohortaea acidophila]KAF2484941.1 thiamine diphosphate-binding protein [Neohortaea acidophila]
MGKHIPFAQYLFRRLTQLHCHSLHGVPGDFFLRALDHIPQSGLRWIGNASELCAGYAADGYARVGSQLLRHKPGLRSGSSPIVGALMTTYGVGELSATNAVAGAYAESVPVVHFVGTPSRKAMWGDNKLPVHHTLGDGRMNVYAEMAKSISCSRALLYKYDDITTAAELYDEALQMAVIQSKPVYVGVASDMFEQPVLEDMLEKPLDTKPPLSNWRSEDTVLDVLLDKLRTSRRPLIIADGLSYHFDFQSEINALVSLTGIPSMCFTFGKGVIDESLPTWDPALPNTTEYSQNADLVLIFGPVLGDTNTAGWSAIPDVQNTFLFNLDSVAVSGHVVPNVRSRTLLQRLLMRLKEENVVRKPKFERTQRDAPRKAPSANSTILQDDLWPALSDFVKPEDTLLLANGTPLVGGRAIQLKSGCQVIASPIWNAIGSMLPAAQGVALAKRDHQLPGRTILLEGDGSFQVTAQSISDIIRYKLDVTIFIANNAGYTYERWLNGMHAEYNDVPAWRYTDAPRFFGVKEDDPTYPTLGRRVQTWGELQEVLHDDRVGDGKGLKIIDIVLDPEDVPEKAKPGLARASNALRTT